MSSSDKHLTIPLPTKPSTHPPRKKVATKTDDWNAVFARYSTQESQTNLVSRLHSPTKPPFSSVKESLNSSAHSPPSKNHSIPTLILRSDPVQMPETPDFDIMAINILLNHLKTKQSGYRQQDTIKGLYDPDRFVGVSDIVALLSASNLSCFYCRKWAVLFYENVRDPRQWSLERLSNSDGHNRENVVIACLECNMRRRTMYHERYIATKQLTVNKLESEIKEDGV